MNSLLQQYNQERKQRAKELQLRVDNERVDQDLAAAAALNKNKKPTGKRCHFDYDVMK